jgi:hypothetical protein
MVLEHDPVKWIPVHRTIMRQTKIKAAPSNLVPGSGGKLKA